jgi:hypothetical protein
MLSVTVTLVPNRDDRPRYATLVHYVLCEDPDTGERFVVPTRRTLEWVEGARGERALICTRVTELAWKAIRPGVAPRELAEQWKAHRREQEAAVQGEAA